MKRAYWIGLILVALVVGVLVGYGVWGTKAAQVADLDSKVQQLTQENADLRSKLALAPTPAAPGSQAPAAVDSGTAEKKL
jgi:hypothetical protein